MLGCAVVAAQLCCVLVMRSLWAPLWVGLRALLWTWCVWDGVLLVFARVVLVETNTLTCELRASMTVAVAVGANELRHSTSSTSPNMLPACLLNVVSFQAAVGHQKQCCTCMVQAESCLGRCIGLVAAAHYTVKPSKNRKHHQTWTHIKTG